MTEAKESYLWDEMNINIAAVTMLTRIVLPGMLRRHRGAIVNISSIAGGIKPLPLLAVYSASKVRTETQAANLGNPRYFELFKKCD